MQIKKKLLRLFFVCEIMVFCWIYCFDAHGLKSLYQKRQTRRAFEEKIQSLQADVERAQLAVVVFNSDPFYKERIARERLQMARTGDLIYYIE